MADFEIKGFEEGWLLTPTIGASRLWCQSNLEHEVRKSGAGRKDHPAARVKAAFSDYIRKHPAGEGQMKRPRSSRLA